MKTYLQSKLFVLDKRGQVVFTILCTRWLERKPGITTGARYLNRLLRRHFPGARKTFPVPWCDRRWAFLVARLHEGASGVMVIGLIDDERNIFFDKMIEDPNDPNEMIPVPNSGIQKFQNLTGLQLTANPSAPEYKIGANKP